MMIARKYLSKKINQAIERSAITCILGPRQCGKTTISKLVGAGYQTTFFDLEDPIAEQIFKSSAMLTLGALGGLVVLDEIQRMPELFKILRILADRTDNKARFLLLGSASPTLMKHVSESLAGRVTFVDMSGFGINEITENDQARLWYRGGFPRSYLAEKEEDSFSWRLDFIRTFLERDIPQLGISVPADTMRRFWTMLAHFHGQLWNGSEFARSIGATEPTARKYLDILTGAYVVRQIQPWYENIGKRQVKSPKVYIRDSGILHALLFLNADQIRNHPKVGASWEGFVIDQLINVIDSPVYFWATHSGAELDLFTIRNGVRTGFEIKFSDAPGLTKSMMVAMEDLYLDKLYVIYPGPKSYLLSEKIEVVPAWKFISTQLPPASSIYTV